MSPRLPAGVHVAAVAASLTLLSCRRPPPPPTPGILVVTTPAGTDLSAIDAELPSVVRFDAAWAHARHTRPALASLWTGVPPHEHGLTDPTLHDLPIPTVASEVSRTWRTCRHVLPGTPDPLYADEQWGFTRSGTCTGPSSLTWLHASRPLDVVDAITAWQARSPGGTVVLTGLPTDRPLEQGGGRVPLFCIGPACGEPGVRDDLQGQSAIATAIRRTHQPRAPDQPAPELFPALDIPRIEAVDALPRLAAGGPVVWIERTPGNTTRESIALPPPTDRLRAPWPAHPGLPTDPLGQQEGPASAASLDLLEDARRALDQGRFRDVRDRLDQSARRVGPTVAGELLRARLEWKTGDPRAGLDRMIRVYDEQPSTPLAARIGHAALALRRPDIAIPWLDRVLAQHPDDAPTLAARIRCARAAGSPTVADSLTGRLWSLDPHWAARVAIREALDTQQPFPPDWEALLDAPPATRPSGRVDPDVRLLRARIDWQAGRWAEGLEALESLVEQHPRHIDTRLTLAAWSLEMGDATRASRLLGPVRRWFPDDLRVSALARLTQDALADERMRLQWLRGIWRNRP